MQNGNRPKRSLKWPTILLLDALIIIALIVYFGWLRPHTAVTINGTYLSHPTEVEEFHFVDDSKLPFSKKNLRGHWSILFFGFTSCPMICPTTMAELNKMYQKLQQELPQNQLPKIVFISVDPERDSVNKIHQFVRSFNPHFVGIRSNLTATLALEKQLHLPTSTDPSSHSAELLLLNPDVKVQAYFAYPHRATQIAADYKLILKATKPT
jgi:protein SCO1/2